MARDRRTDTHRERPAAARLQPELVLEPVGRAGGAAARARRLATIPNDAHAATRADRTSAAPRLSQAQRLPTPLRRACWTSSSAPSGRELPSAAPRARTAQPLDRHRRGRSRRAAGADRPLLLRRPCARSSCPVGAAAALRARARRAPLRRTAARVRPARDGGAGAGVQRHRGQPGDGRGGAAAARRPSPGRARRRLPRGAARPGVRRPRPALPARQRGARADEPPARRRPPRPARSQRRRARRAAEVLALGRAGTRPRARDRRPHASWPAISPSATAATTSWPSARRSSTSPTAGAPRRRASACRRPPRRSRRQSTSPTPPRATVIEAGARSRPTSAARAARSQGDRSILAEDRGLPLETRAALVGAAAARAACRSPRRSASDTPIYVGDASGLAVRFPVAGRARPRVRGASADRLRARRSACAGRFVLPALAFDAGERDLLEALATQSAVALARAQLYEREHAVAQTLQASLLPRALPRHPGPRPGRAAARRHARARRRRRLLRRVRDLRRRAGGWRSATSAARASTPRR